MGGALAGGGLVLVGRRGDGHSTVCGQLADASAAAKTNDKVSAELWRSRTGHQYFVARGCFHVPDELNTALMGLIRKKVEGVPTEILPIPDIEWL